MMSLNLRCQLLLSRYVPKHLALTSHINHLLIAMTCEDILYIYSTSQHMCAQNSPSLWHPGVEGPSAHSKGGASLADSHTKLLTEAKNRVTQLIWNFFLDESWNITLKMIALYTLMAQRRRVEWVVCLSSRLTLTPGHCSRQPVCTPLWQALWLSENRDGRKVVICADLLSFPTVLDSPGICLLYTSRCV